MASVRKSLLLSVAQRHTVILMSLVSTVVLARILTPEEFGVFGVAFAVVSIAASLREFGIGDLIVKEREIRRETLRAAFALNLLIAWTLGLAYMIFSSSVARLYGDPRIAEVIQVLSLTFFILPFGISTNALLRRNMAFERIFWINVAGSLANTAGAISLALMGFGVMSLAYASVAGVFSHVAATMLLGRPQLMWPSLHGVRKIVAFGGMTSLLGMVTKLGEQLPAILVGRTLGLDAVGILGRAQRAISPFRQIVIQGLMPVALPAFAKHGRSGRDLKQPYLLSTQYLSALAWPFFIFLAAMADPLVALILGGQWSKAVPIVQILCATGAVLPLRALDRPVFVALDRLKELFIIQMAGQPVRILLVILTSFHSLTAVAITIAFFPFVIFACTQRALLRALSYTSGELANSLSQSVVVTVLCSIPLVPNLIAYHQDPKPAFIHLLFGIGTMIPAWAIAVVAVRHPIRLEIYKACFTATNHLPSSLRKRVAPRTGKLLNPRILPSRS